MPAPERPPLLADVAELLHEPGPWPLLELVSSLLTAVDRRSPDPFARTTPAPEPGGVDLPGLVRSFLEIDELETTALLTVIAELVADEVMTRRIRRELAARSHDLPHWLDALAPPRLTKVLGLAHVLADGENVALGLRTAAGDEGTLIAYVDHRLGTLVKDAFVVPSPLSEVADRFLEAAHEDPDLTVTARDGAETRAWLSDAIEVAASMSPPYETDTWPATRPLLEWVLRHLPPGGAGHQPPVWSEHERAALLEAFLTSGHGREHDHDRGRALSELLLLFGCEAGPRDPLRWSSVAVELVLLDWLPRTARLPTAELADAPRVLADLVRFGHQRLGIREELTKATVDTVAEVTGEYATLIRDRGSRSPQAALARIVGGGEDDRWDLDVDHGLVSNDYREIMLDLLRAAVGGEDALRTLPTDPLPDEPFDASTLPGDVAGRVTEVAALTDRCCEELLDREHRTACRRLLADVAAADPRIFRRRGRPETAAAAIVWIVVKANRSLESYRPGGLSAKGLAQWFGVAGSPSQRAATLLRALGIDPAAHPYGDLPLGTPRYLVGARRAGLLEHWHRVLDQA